MLSPPRLMLPPKSAQAAQVLAVPALHTRSVATFSPSSGSPNAEEEEQQHDPLADNEWWRQLVVERGSHLFTRYAWDRMEESMRSEPELWRGSRFIMLDVDGFRSKVIDKHGHVVGGRILLQVGSVLRGMLHLGGDESDNILPFRYGGDEFLILVRDMNHSQAVDLARSMCTEIAKHSFDGKLADSSSEAEAEAEAKATTAVAVRLTASFGIGDTLDKADKMLLDGQRAKRCTCPCVCDTARPVDVDADRPPESKDATGTPKQEQWTSAGGKLGPEFQTKLTATARTQPDGTRIICNSAQCLKCDQVLVSAHEHDCKTCKCGALSIDGGLEHLRRLGNPQHVRDLSLKVSPPHRTLEEFYSV